jgi:hypothetical protein
MEGKTMELLQQVLVVSAQFLQKERGRIEGQNKWLAA